MDLKKCNYGIIIRNELLTEASKSQNQQTALMGQIVRIDGSTENLCTVRYLKNGETWDYIGFVCPKKSIQCIEEQLWPFLNAVTSPQERVQLARDRERVHKLLKITTDMVVGFNDDDIVYLGTVKFIGNVKGIGKCFGILLHEKKRGNMCDGSCAGIQYFNCLPGFGVFTSIEKIVPRSYIPSRSPPKKKDIDTLLQKNLSAMNLKPEREKHNYFKTSHSMQNILDDRNSVNTNNDFDQNTILQPENSYLINNHKLKRDFDLNIPENHCPIHRHKIKSEIDLIEVIGGWAGSTDKKQLDSFANLKKNYDKLDDEMTMSRGMRARVKNNNAMINGGSKTVPRKSRLAQDSVAVKNYSSSKFYINDLELNERYKSPPPQPSTSDNDTIFYEPNPSETKDFTVGSLVEVSNDVSDEPLYGVIKWMGIENGSNFVLVGIELEEDHDHLPLNLTDGIYNGRRFFECNGDRGLFVPITRCQKDSRFHDGTPTPVHSITEKTFGKDCPIIPGAVPPLIMKTEDDVEAVCGKFRGIQGHHNSCYLDATLFAMFTYTAVFDSLLYRPKGPNDIPHYDEVQRVLREEIVNPLRAKLFVRADRVMNLRKLLDQLSSVSGLTSEEKDPEEFLNSLLAQILKAEPFLKLNSGQEAYYYQLFVEKDDELKLPTVQQLFEQSFLTSDIKLKEVPSCLIIQMPRFGKNYKMYPRILPSQLLDVTDIIENSPRQCTVCGKLAKWECRECLDECGIGLESTAFCDYCVQVTHNHAKRTNHQPRLLSVPQDFILFAEHCPPPRLYMELFAVVCIETSHYVAFVKCGVGHEAPWCFFDSMADRKGERNGYNIPEMVACPDVSKWLSDEQMCRSLHENAPLDRHLPEHARRLLCDAYICMYQSSDVMMYR